MIDLSKTRFIVTAWPDNRWPVEVVSFVEKLMENVPDRRIDYRDSLVKADRTCARNVAIKESALESHPSYQWFVFIDHDVRPQVETPSFLLLDADVKCCQVPMAKKTAWSHPTSFHEAIWCTSRRVLEAIEAPWFMQQYNADGTEMDGCICSSFRNKVIQAGFTIAHGGWAEHDRDGSWC